MSREMVRAREIEIEIEKVWHTARSWAAESEAVSAGHMVCVFGKDQ